MNLKVGKKRGGKGECGNVSIEKGREVQMERICREKAEEPSKDALPEYKIICQEALCF